MHSIIWKLYGKAPNIFWLLKIFRPVIVWLIKCDVCQNQTLVKKGEKSHAVMIGVTSLILHAFDSKVCFGKLEKCLKILWHPVVLWFSIVTI